MIDNKPQYYFRPTIPPEKQFINTNKDIVDIDDDEAFEYQKPQSNKVRNTLLGSLVALAAITIPTVQHLDKSTTSAQVDYNITTQDKDKTEIICNPELIAKGGKSDSIVETREFLNLLNFSAMDNLPKGTKSGIEMVASAHYQPVNIGDVNAKEKLIQQVQDIQEMVDKCIENSLKNPSKTYTQKMLEHKLKYITSEEIIDRVDFSEALKYQRDVSVLKALLRNSVPRIERKDYDSNERANNEVKKAQDFVNKLVEQYKLYGKIAGNSDYNNILSKSELVDLLNHQSLEGIDKWTKKEIISKATESYTPITFDKIKDENKIKEKNKIIGEEVQKAQDILDMEALNYKLTELSE